MKQPEEILNELFETVSQDCTTPKQDLQLAITLNPDLDKIVLAMERYASQFSYDFSKTCECKNSPGETWCCNHCGLPVTEKNKK